MSARVTALHALIACRKQSAWSDGILKEYIQRDGLDRRDAALASRLCYGVLQSKILLDFYISHFLRGKLKDLQPVVLDILRLGVYQIVFMDKIPTSAAVNESVELGKKYANRQASGLINGLLRNVVRQKDNLPQPTDLETKYSHSKALTALLRENVGDELLEPLLLSHNTPPKTMLQVNPLRGETQAVLHELEEAGAEPQLHPWLPNCIVVSGTGNLERLPCFQEGRVYVQDPAAKLSVLAAAPKENMKVLDVCSAPGGKSFASAMEMKNRGTIQSCDIHPHKVQLIEKGAARLGISILSACQQDAKTFVPAWENAFDLVIADVPCSGLGVIRKKPDIREKDLSKLADLPPLQKEILQNVSRYVKPGGVLLYSTCTILKRENEEVAQDFLKKNPSFEAEDFHLCGDLHSQNGMLTLLPCLHDTDGFFICKMRKCNEN
ncbi:MAG: 16S rRNA (cytosine(967)-C(5))-methyltransferase RsmB [Oscillospiraceae bacterium]|nr:16S rRNA (cytosine(967)-C(5))-methyltransferase RsmB [Oscillospiraceae bacterium]